MIRHYITTHYATVFTGLISFVIALSLIAPRAASFAAPVAGLLLFAGWWIARGEIIKPRLREMILILAFPALAALSALWAIDPPFAIERAIKLLPILIGGILFIEVARRQGNEGLSSCAVRGLMLLYTLLCAGIALEIFWDLKIYRLVNAVPDDQFTSIVLMNRSVVVASVLSLPLFLLLYKSVLARKEKIILGLISALALLAALVQTESQSAQLFVLLSAAFIFLFPVKSRAAWIALGSITCLCAMAAPWIAQYLFAVFPNQPGIEHQGIMRAASIPHRLEVWNFVATEALKHPWLGQGIEAIRYIKSENWLVLPNANNMLHPHNAPLQLWVEFGVVGITLGCMLFVSILTRLWQLPTLERRVGLGALIAVVAVMSTGYGLWQSWQIGLLLTLAGLLSVAMGPATRIKP